MAAEATSWHAELTTAADDESFPASRSCSRTIVCRVKRSQNVGQVDATNLRRGDEIDTSAGSPPSPTPPSLPHPFPGAAVPALRERYYLRTSARVLYTTLHADLPRRRPHNPTRIASCPTRMNIWPRQQPATSPRRERADLPPTCKFKRDLIRFLRARRRNVGLYPIGPKCPAMRRQLCLIT